MYVDILPPKMAKSMDLRMCTFNCRSLKNCIPEIYRLCDSHDFVLIQEHRLLPTELDLLNNVHPDFLSYGLSAVDITLDILIGRPYGGTAILYRKSYADCVNVITSQESRICGIQINTNLGPILLICVYMPTNYGDDSSLESYIDCLGKLHAMMVECDNIHTVIAGDFNCGPGSRFFSEFKSFSDNNNLIVSDMKRYSDGCTYISDDGLRMSWLDHLLASATIDNVVDNITIHNEVIVSDHKPVSFHLKGCIPNSTVSDKNRNRHTDIWLPNWQQCDAIMIANYRHRLDVLLQEVHVPWELFLAQHDLCDNSISAMDEFYKAVFTCISAAVHDTIPGHRSSYSHFNIPGWNTYVKEKHESAREAYLDWLRQGKPKLGFEFDNMKRTRALFKLAVRYCRNHVEEMKADACATALMDKDCKTFWKSVYRISNSKATNHINSINGVTGSDNVAGMWKNHFENIYSKGNSKYRNTFESRLMAHHLDTSDLLFTIHDVISAVNKQKLSKAAGPDGLQMEAFIYGSHRMFVYLTMLFNMFMKFGYLPNDFCCAVTIPLVKNKNANVTDVNNYRAIAISNAISKLLEDIMYRFLDSADAADEYQFGFKKGLSTGFCTHTFKETVHYYRQRGSHVFCCFIDFSKAFDSVDYWLLFCKLLDYNKSTSCYITVRLLAFWYSHQQICVRWQNCHSACFSVCNGVRQGGVLSPFLFRVYIRDLINSVVNSNVGCHIAGICVNLLAYADDIVLLAPSWSGLQKLLDIIEKAAKAVDLSFNTNKTVCMVAGPYNKHKTVCQSFPQFMLTNRSLSYVTQFKYLGHIIENTFCDNADINRELKNLFGRANVLIRRFSSCSSQVKLRLFRSYCICFYDIALWKNFHVTILDKLASAYVKCLKLFFGFPKYCSVSAMLIQLGLPSFNTLLHNAKIGFMNRFSRKTGTVVDAIRLSF